MANLHLIPEVPHTSSMIIVTWPFGCEHGHLARELHAAHRNLSEVFNSAHISFANFTALSSVVNIRAYDGGCDPKEDEPVARR